MNTIVLTLCLAGIATAATYPARFARAPQQYYEQPVQYVSKQVVTQTQTQPLVKPIAIVSQSSNLQFDGNFNHAFVAENGISEEATGSIKVLDPKTQAQVIQGRYSYTAPDGTPIEAVWYADETGFHIEGAHIPTPPPVPEAIARSLEYIRSLPPAKEEPENRQ